jgi:hypothetical protein
MPLRLPSSFHYIANSDVLPHSLDAATSNCLLAAYKSFLVSEMFFCHGGA